MAEPATRKLTINLDSGPVVMNVPATASQADIEGIVQDYSSRAAVVKNPLLNPVGRAPAAGPVEQLTGIGAGGKLARPSQGGYAPTREETLARASEINRGMMSQVGSAAATALVPGAPLLKVALAAGAGGAAGSLVAEGLDALIGQSKGQDRNAYDAAYEAVMRGAGITVTDLGFRGIAGGIFRALHPFGQQGRTAAAKATRELLESKGIENATAAEIADLPFLRAMQNIADASIKGDPLARARNKALYEKFGGVIRDTVKDFGEAASRQVTGVEIQRGINRPISGTGGEPPFPGIKGTFQHFQEEVAAKAFGPVREKAKASGAELNLKDLMPDLEELANEMKESRRVLGDKYVPEVPILEKLLSNERAKRDAIDAAKTEWGDSLVFADAKAAIERKYAPEIPFTEAMDLRTLLSDKAFVEAAGTQGRRTTRAAAMTKRVNSAITDKLEEIANEHGFLPEWKAARSTYSEGLGLWDESVLPSMLMKDPARLVSSIPKTSAGVDEWEALMQGLTKYGDAGKKAARMAQRQFIEDIVAPNEGPAQFTDLADRMGMVHPDVVKATGIGKTWGDLKEVAEALRRFKNINPLGSEAGEKLVQKSIHEAVESAVATPIGSSAALAPSVRAQMTYWVSRVLRRMGTGRLAYALAYNPRAKEFFLNGLTNLNKGNVQAGASMLRTAWSLSLSRDEMRSVRDEAEALRDQENSLFDAMSKKGLGGKRLSLAAEPQQDQAGYD